MGTSRRLQVVAAIGAVLFLAGAWVLTVTGEDRASSAGSATSTTARATTSTSTSSAPDDGSTTSTPPRAQPPNTRWGGINLTDVTKQAGLDSPQSKTEATGSEEYAGGAAVADYDDDGDQDVFLTRIGLANRLMRNDGKGRFTDVAKRAGVAGKDQRNGYAAPVWADVDGDGDLDLFMTGATRGGALLLQNDGRGHFRDITAKAGLDRLAGEGLNGTASFGAAFDDWDHDGDLDLVVLQWYRWAFELRVQLLPPTSGDALLRLDPCDFNSPERGRPTSGLPPTRSRMFENDGNGRFRNATAGSGVDLRTTVGFQPQFADIDGDGWDDLFITGDFCTSRLYRNLEGKGFEDITTASGTGTDRNGMGSVIADLDGDGNLDWFVSAITPSKDTACTPAVPCTGGGNRLYLGDGTGHFVERSKQFGVFDGSWGWGGVAADLNLDGRTDLAMANGVRNGLTSEVDRTHGDGSHHPDAGDITRVWLNTGTTPWPDVAQQIGVRDRDEGKALVAFDADGDGDLDLLVANSHAAPILYRNDTPPGRDKHWLQLRLRDPGSPNPYAIGARVVVTVGDGSAPRPLEVRAGGSFQSSDPTDLHLGLGGAARVRRIEVRWPGRAEPTVLEDVAADQVVDITPR